MKLRTGIELVSALAFWNQSPAGRPPASGAEGDTVSWIVRVADTGADFLLVHADFTPPVRDSLRLRFAYLDRRPGSVRGLRAAGPGAACRASIAQTSQNDFVVTRGGCAGIGQLAYEIDPTMFPPGSDTSRASDMRSRLTPSLGILRGASVFAAMAPGSQELVHFELPAGWTTITPWPRRGAAFAPGDLLLSETFGIGRFSASELDLKGVQVRVAAADGVSPELGAAVPTIVRDARAWFGPLTGSTIRSVILVPQQFMSGGAAGRASAVLAPSAEVLAHELLHWWNDASLTAADAMWFREGFTNYFGLQLAWRAGLWSAEQVNGCVLELDREMRRLDTDPPIPLLAASSRAATDSRMSRLVYAKGTLLARALDVELLQRNDSLSRYMRAVFASGGRDLSSADVQRLLQHGMNPEVTRLMTSIVEGTATMPALAIGGPPMGCSRF